MKKSLFVGMLGMALALGLVFTGCDGGGGSNGPKSETFTGTADGKTYTLVITDDTSYVLTVGTKKSSGSATKSGSTWTLNPSGGTAFTVSVNSMTGITDITGTITYEDATTETAPETITPPANGGGGDSPNEWGGDSNLIGVWKDADDEVLTFTSTTVTRESRWLPSFTGNYTAKDGKLTIQNMFEGASIPYSIVGNVLTVNIFGRYDPDSFTKQGTGGGGDNPFMGTWTGSSTSPQGTPVPGTFIFAATTFESSFTIGGGAILKQKGTYTYTQTTITVTVTAIDVLGDGGISQTGGWISEGEIFDEYSGGGSFTGTLSDGKLTAFNGTFTKQ
ncbi:hypothetical protein AGMMS4952_22220 [Spirochaetia bacterium]|nr:hypothetical protein AGMMS4952_22220 [Spirochaetia bacterium]